MEQLKKFEHLKCFYITRDVNYNSNKKIIKLLIALSKIKTLFLIDIKIKAELKLTKNEENKINAKLPDISIKRGKEESSIIWYNINYTLMISS